MDGFELSVKQEFDDADNKLDMESWLKESSSVKSDSSVKQEVSEDSNITNWPSLLNSDRTELPIKQEISDEYCDKFKTYGPEKYVNSVNGNGSKINITNVCGQPSSVSEHRGCISQIPFERNQEILPLESVNIKVEPNGSVFSDITNQGDFSCALNSEDLINSEIIPLNIDKQELKELVADDAVNLINCDDSELCENSTNCTNTGSVEVNFLNVDSFKSDEAYYTTKYSDYQANHLKINRSLHNKTFKCFACNFTTKWDGSLYKHINRNHTQNANGFKCSKCSYTAKLKYDLTEHIKIKHNENGDIFKCNVCDFTTKWKTSLLRHAKTNHLQGVDVFKCDKCSYTAKWKFNLTVHFRTNHAKDGNILKCEVCDFSTKYRGSLYKHSKRSHVDNLGVRKCGKRSRKKRTQ